MNELSFFAGIMTGAFIVTATWLLEKHATA